MKLISELTNSQKRRVNDRATRRLKSLHPVPRDATGPNIGAMHMTKSNVLQLPSGDQVLVVIGPVPAYEPYSTRVYELSEPVVFLALDELLMEVTS
jgi:hypothetical protein